MQLCDGVCVLILVELSCHHWYIILSLYVPYTVESLSLALGSCSFRDTFLIEVKQFVWSRLQTFFPLLARDRKSEQGQSALFYKSWQLLVENWRCVVIYQRYISQCVQPDDVHQSSADADGEKVFYSNDIKTEAAQGNIFDIYRDRWSDSVWIDWESVIIPIKLFRAALFCQINHSDETKRLNSIQLTLICPCLTHSKHLTVKVQVAFNQVLCSTLVILG